VFFIWLAYADRPGIIEESDKHFEQLARDRGCTAMEHVSGRWGWAKRNPSGWKAHQMTFRKELVP